MTEQRLKILHVVRQFHPSTGGLETYVHELASRQATRHEVSVLTLDRVFGRPDRLPRTERMGGLHVIRAPFIGYRRLFLPLIGPGTVAGYDFIHLHAADQLLDVIAAISVLRPLRLTMTTHGLFFHTEALATVKKIYLRTITKWSLSRMRRVFAVSGNDAATLRKVGVESTLLRNPIVPLGNFISEGTDLLYVGRISENKRIDALVAFMAQLVRQQPAIRLHIVGNDSEGLWPGYAREIAEQGLGDSILYHGFVAPKALIEIAKTCGFSVSASRYEGFGLSVIEGMSVGLLPFMHRNAAFEETQRLSGCGLLTNFDDPAAAAQEFAAWIPRVSRAEREKAAQFAHAQSWDAVVSAYEQEYSRA